MGDLPTHRLHHRRRSRVFQGVGAASADQFVEQQAQGIDIAGGGDVLAPQLFRAGVLRSHQPLVVGSGDDGVGGQSRIEQFGDAKVQELGKAVSGDQDIRGFQIAVDNQALMGGLDCRADGAEEFYTLAQVEAALDQLDSDLFAVGIVVSQCQVDHAHAALAERPQHPIGADAAPFVAGLAILCRVRLGLAEHRIDQKTARQVVGFEQGLNFSA